MGEDDSEAAVVGEEGGEASSLSAGNVTSVVVVVVVVVVAAVVVVVGSVLSLAATSETSVPRICCKEVLLLQSLSGTIVLKVQNFSVGWKRSSPGHSKCLLRYPSLFFLALWHP